VVYHYRERINYVGINDSYLGPVQELILAGGPLFRDSTAGWIVFHPGEGMAESYVLVILRGDTMRIDLPEDPKQLVDRAWRRWDRETPEVVRFRKGHCAMEQLAAGPWAIAAAQHLAKQLIAEDDAAYKQQLADLEEYYRELPSPAPPPTPYIPPAPMTPEQWEAERAKLPGLKNVQVDRTSADTVWVRFTGRVMLNGGCGSGMPLFGVELMTDTGWVERIPFELIQMDRGMPWADWEDHTVMIPPLRWWVGAHSPEGQKELAPGSYRFFFVGGDRKEKRTAPFAVE